MVLAAQAVAQDAGAIALAERRRTEGRLLSHLSRCRLAGKPITVANTGTNAAQVVLSVTGNPTGFEPAVAQGYAVERTCTSSTELGSKPARCQNERLVTVLKVTESQARAARLLLVDRLPAGFEIDNPARRQRIGRGPRLAQGRCRSGA